MKIAVPVLDKDFNKTEISPSFGRAPYFLFYDTQSETKKFVENTASSSQGGAGIAAAQLLVDIKVEVLLTPRCGQNAAQVITSAGIRIYKTKSADLQGNLKSFLQDDLEELKNIHAGLHRSGGK